MTPNADIMAAVKQLDHTVTVGDVAVQTGLNIQTVENDLLFLASESGAHLQVSETGDVVYRFPKNLQGILQQKYWQLRAKALWSQLWTILFFLIRISVGLLLIASIILVTLAIAVVVIGVQISSQSQSGSSDRDRQSSYPSPMSSYQLNIFLQGLFRVFRYQHHPYRRRQTASPSRQREKPSLNWLEAIFSFFFGDGNPNADLEDRRWNQIGHIIRQRQGAIVAEHIAPYLDGIERYLQLEDEDYILPVLTRFDGRPQVTDSGNLIYQFPDLQATVDDPGASLPSQSPFLEETPWRFSHATGGQMVLAASLGIANIVGVIWLGLLPDVGPQADFYAIYELASRIYIFLLAYALLLGITPIIRFVTIQQRNLGIKRRNQSREERSQHLAQPDDSLRQKLNESRQFTIENRLSASSTAYTTERGLTEQSLEQADKIDQDWQRRLKGDR